MNHFLLIHTLAKLKSKLSTQCQLVPLKSEAYVQELELIVNQAEISNAVEFINPDERPEDIPQGQPRKKRYFNHFTRIDKDRFLIADQDETNCFNMRTNSLTSHLDYSKLNLNAFNYAHYRSLEFIFPQGGKVHVFNKGVHVCELEETFSGLLPFINYANTSRCVQFKDKNLYFLDNKWSLYWYQMDKSLKLVESGQKKLPGVLIHKDVDYFCLSDNGHDLFIANSKKSVQKYQCGLSFQLPEKERVTVMTAAYGMVVTATMEETKEKKPDKTNRYYFHCQNRLKEVIPPYTKTDSRYLTNMVQSILLHKLKHGILMVGLPNYQICDLFFLNKRTVTVLQKDKPFQNLCHWTMLADQHDDCLDLYLGTMSGIYKLQFKV